jgi:ribosomal protein S18 acetylase RimI-like enzyme
MNRKLIRFRPAGLEDYPAVCRLITSPAELVRVFPSGSWPFNMRQLHYIAEKRTDLTVVTDNDEVVGFANLYDMAPRKRAFIGNVILKASHRRQGIGKCLVQHMLDRVFTLHELPEARISVFEDNTPALTLYRQLGFKTCGRELRKVSDGRAVDLLQMKLARL